MANVLSTFLKSVCVKFLCCCARVLQCQPRWRPNICATVKCPRGKYVNASFHSNVSYRLPMALIITHCSYFFVIILFSLCDDDIVSWLPESKQQKPAIPDKKRNMHNGHDEPGMINYVYLEFIGSSLSTAVYCLRQSSTHGYMSSF